MEKKDIEDKIVLLRLRGDLEVGKNSDIKFSQIEEVIKRKKAYFFLKNTYELKTKEANMEIKIEETEDVEEDTIKNYVEKNPSNFNKFVPQLIDILSKDKQEGETSEVFFGRLLDESKKVLNF